MFFNEIKNYRGEIWKALESPKEDQISPKEKFFVSNYGRIIKLEGETPRLVDPYLLNGYPHIKIKTTETKIYRGYTKHKYKGYYVHKLVAQCFLKNTDGIYVIHLDYDKENNQVSNLKWVTKREKELHQWKNPRFIEAKKNADPPYSKLTENKVRLIKKMLNNPERKTRLKMIAKQFGVSTTQLKRIQTGENWGHVPSL